MTAVIGSDGLDTGATFGQSNSEMVTPLTAGATNALKDQVQTTCMLHCQSSYGVFVFPYQCVIAPQSLPGAGAEASPTPSTKALNKQLRELR
jgi:hypothetical protein